MGELKNSRRTNNLFKLQLVLGIAWIFHTAAQIALDYLKEILDTLDPTNPDPLLEKRLVDTSRDFERYVQEGLQKDASQ